MSVADVKKTAEQKMQKSLESLKTDLSKIRTGRAHTGILDHVMADYYGNPTPVPQMANVTLIDSRTIGVIPWEKKMVGVIEKAIRDSDLGLNPATQGDTIRVPMPSLTEERRRDLIKVVKSRFAICAATPTTRSRIWSKARLYPRISRGARRTMYRN
jgi:ribosome recycling factor